MTDDRMALADLLEKGSHGDLPRERMALMAEHLMQADMDAHVGAAASERSQARENWRNGYRAHDWHTRAGTIPLRIPKLRIGSHLSLAAVRGARRACGRASSTS